MDAFDTLELVGTNDHRAGADGAERMAVEQARDHLARPPAKARPELGCTLEKSHEPQPRARPLTHAGNGYDHRRGTELHAGAVVGAPIVIREWGLSRRVRGSFYAVKSALAEPLRGRDRSIVWTPEVGLGVGNQMYLWLHAFNRQRSGEDCRVLSGNGADDFVRRFPRLRALVIERGSVRFRDGRDEIDAPWLWQRAEVDFTLHQLRAFIDEFILPELGPRHDLSVVNVRRGDFYEEYLEKYGFDIAGYFERALPPAMARVVVVSDDPDWCREHLGEVLTRAEEVSFAPQGAVTQFELLAGARELFVTNSTFGYWGGYIASAQGASVTAPWIHARGLNGNAAYQLLPSWTRIGPGPWDRVPLG